MREEQRDPKSRMGSWESVCGHNIRAPGEIRAAGSAPVFGRGGER